VGLLYLAAEGRGYFTEVERGLRAMLVALLVVEEVALLQHPMDAQAARARRA
jgi:hypothetical protein